MPFADEHSISLQVEQWTENRYPSFVSVGVPAPTSAADWVEGADARIKQLGKPADLDRDPGVIEAHAQRARAAEQNKMTKEDVRRFRSAVCACHY